MLTFCTGNLFESNAEALVNAVNCVGVMGKGIAAQFKVKFPKMFLEYQALCNRGILCVGKTHIAQENGLWIVNVPTKIHWADPSQYEYLEAGLARLFAHTIPTLRVKSIALPALGCGLGGLAWDRVKPLIRHWYGVFDDTDLSGQVDVRVYEPQE